jgi:CheY-like chemotaxis protein
VEAANFHVLLVEDDPNDVLVMRRAFLKAGLTYPLTVVDDGSKAIAYLSGQAPYQDRGRYPLPSYILLDLKMPRVSGLEILEWLRHNPNFRHTPVTMLSGSSESRDIDRAKQLGIASYLIKPVIFQELLAMVQELGRHWDGLRNETVLPADGVKPSKQSDQPSG